MRTRSLVFSAILVLGLAAAAGAQAPSDPDAQQLTSQPDPAIDASRLGLNLSRIQRGLQRSAERQDYDGLNLRFYINVFAPAPEIKLFTPLDNLLYGPAPYGGPTHRDMMNVMTPQEFRAPVADFSGLANWFGKKVRK